MGFVRLAVRARIRPSSFEHPAPCERDTLRSNNPNATELGMGMLTNEFLHKFVYCDIISS